jgi:TonB-linked SusC/RagA family outer membrane protein
MTKTAHPIRYLFKKEKFLISLTRLHCVVFLLLIFPCLSLYVSAQNPSGAITVTGKVLNEKGEPLAMASVSVKGSNNTAITKPDGTFTIRASGNKSILVASYVGYETREQTLGNQASISIVLSQVGANLSDVVVVGYGTKRQSELSSSVTVVNEKALQKGVTSGDLGTMLQGKVPGLVVSNASGHPQRATNIVIRGVGSIGAGYAPLYVVDGIIGGSAEPNDIASVTILKDAAATGLYGSRAANGVIIITTKTGKSGKTRVSYAGSAGLSYYQKGNLHMMDSQEFYDNRKEAAQNYYNDQKALSNPAFTNRTFDQYLQSSIPSTVLNTNSNWADLLTRVGNVNKQSLSVSGGDSKTSFYIGGNYYSEIGTLVGEKFTRYNLRANLKHQISDRFTLTWRVNTGLVQYPNDPQDGQEAVAVQAVINVPWDPVYEADGVTPYNPYKSGTWYANNKGNYFYDSQHYSDKSREMNFNTDLQLDVKILDWMTFSTSNRWGYLGTEQKQLLDKNHFSASFENGRLTQTSVNNNNLLSSNLLKMNKNFGDHNFSMILGQEYNYITVSNTVAVGKDIPVGLDALNATASAKSVAGTTTETSFLSYFGQVDYNYANRYFLIGSLRSDASSLFGANNRWASFYSIGGSWIVNKEHFLSNTAWIDLLKLRLSYGTTGNANIAPFLSLGTYGFALANTYNGLSGARPARLENPDLTWETAQTTNIGLEFSILKRIKLEIDLYKRDNKSLLQNVALPAATGFASQQRNVGSVRNQGVDINLTTVNTDGPVRWETNLNLNFNRNKVLTLNQGKDIANGTMQIREGLPLRYFYMKEWAGVDPQNGNPLWVRWEDANGALINGADKKQPGKILTTSNYNNASNLFVRSAYPDYTGGLRNDLFYKNFTFSVLANFVVGQWINFTQRSSIDDDGTVLSKNQMIPLKDWTRWRQPGDIATLPRLVLGGNLNSSQPSSRYVEDGSYLRIQNVTFGYNLPKVFAGMGLYVRVDNVAVFTKYSGADPDVNMESPVASQTQVGENFGVTRKIIFGVNLNL